MKYTYVYKILQFALNNSLRLRYRLRSRLRRNRNPEHNIIDKECEKKYRYAFLKFLKKRILFLEMG